MSALFLSQQRRLCSSIGIFDVSTEPNFDSEIQSTVAWVNWAMWLSSSVFGNKLLILRSRNYSPLCLKIYNCHDLIAGCFEKALDEDLYNLKVIVAIDNTS